MTIKKKITKINKKIIRKNPTSDKFKKLEGYINNQKKIYSKNAEYWAVQTLDSMLKDMRDVYNNSNNPFDCIDNLITIFEVKNEFYSEALKIL
jgi:hypothetical protein